MRYQIDVMLFLMVFQIFPREKDGDSLKHKLKYLKLHYGGRLSIQREIHYSIGQSDDASQLKQWKAAKKGTEEILLAQQEGAAAVMKCLAKYRKKKIYTRNDIVHSYYKLVRVRQSSSPLIKNDIYYKWDALELVEQTVGAFSTMSPQYQLQYKNDLRSIGCTTNGIPPFCLMRKQDGGGIFRPPYPGRKIRFFVYDF